MVHGRTKSRVTARAYPTGRRLANLPAAEYSVIANGEIWDWQSAQQCMAISGCDAVTIGRGALKFST
ncbi:tRNA-dihydrouridine synthase [Shigella flexneri]